MPPAPEYPPTFPSEQTTLWHGITGAKGFAASAPATALEARGFPTAQAMSLYERVSPRGIFAHSSQTRR